jgi:hypothetical protein
MLLGKNEGLFTAVYGINNNGKLDFNIKPIISQKNNRK